MKEFSDIQQVVLDTYMGGAGENLKTMEEVEKMGDGLLTWVLRELSFDEGCKTFGTAADRLRGAIDDLEDVFVAVDERYVP